MWVSVGFSRNLNLSTLFSLYRNKHVKQLNFKKNSCVVSTACIVIYDKSETVLELEIIDLLFSDYHNTLKLCPQKMSHFDTHETPFLDDIVKMVKIVLTRNSMCV